MAAQPFVVWITGASSGIGEALAHVYARQNAVLVLSARRENELQRVKQALQLPDGQIVIAPLDLAQPDTLPQVVAQVLAKTGHIDLMIHNGGISQRAYFKETDLPVFRRIMEVNFFGTVALTKALVPHMAARKSGKFVVITSVAGKLGTPLRTAYAASKHALHGFFDSLRAELHHDQVGVLMVCPGYVRTQISLNALTGDGSPQGTMDQNQQNGLAPEYVAQKIARAAAGNKLELYVGGLKEVAGVYLKRFFPQILAKMVVNVNREQ